LHFRRTATRSPPRARGNPAESGADGESENECEHGEHQGRRTVELASDGADSPLGSPALVGRLPFLFLGLALGLGAALYVVTRKHAPPKPPSAAVLARGGCSLKGFPSLGGKHVSGSRPPAAYRIRYAPMQSIGKNPNGRVVTYNSFPPTSGPHYPQWTIWGRYSEPVLEIQAVHNLEHGGVIIQYGRDVPPATVAALRRFYESSPNGMLLAPLPALGSKIVLTAWTYLLTCKRFDETDFKVFRDTFRFEGPERFPASALAPGH
jgi:hypothetical protein